MLKNIKTNYVLFFILLFALTAAGCAAKPDAPAAGSGTAGSSPEQAAQKPAEPVELTISAAASLTDALKDIQKTYESKHANVKLNFNFGASGALQQQIEQGAPADLFLSAASKNMKALVDKQLIDADKQTNLLINELVAIIPADAKTVIERAEDLAKAEVKYVAIGIPESVPAGSYAREALENVRLWDALQPRLVQGKDVRQVLQYVETGNADAGFVYKTDALTSQKVKIAFTVDPATYSPALYPVGIVKAAKHGREAGDFYAYLQSQEALDVFVKYGFSIPK